MANIVPATIEHVPLMVRLWSEQVSGGDSINEVRHCIENYPGYVSLHDRRELTGLSYTFAVSKDTLLLHGLLVAFGHRGKSLGSELLKRTEHAARELGYATILLTNSMQYNGIDKQSALPFYSKRGYRLTHTTPSMPPTYIMTKDL